MFCAALNVNISANLNNSKYILRHNISVFFKLDFWTNALISFFQHTEPKANNSIAMFFQKTLYRGGIRTRLMRCPLHHGAPGNAGKISYF
jgi:hypothetical protein